MNKEMQIRKSPEENLRKEKKMSETKMFLIALQNWILEMKFLIMIRARLYMAIKLADMRHYINDKRYLVLPDGRSGGIMVVNNNEIKHQKKNGKIDQHKGYLELAQLAFYLTPTKRNGTDGMAPEEKLNARKRYIRWQKILNPVFNKAKVGIPIKKEKR